MEISKKKIPKVSVCMITYGHEKYIREAIEGVLMQECNFEIELVIANDCSPDDTGRIVNEVIAQHPRGNLIRYYIHDTNLGMMPNFIFALQECKGKYIALCEGDDYWINKYKLQKQVEILEADISLVACYHNSNLIDSDGAVILKSYLLKNYKKDYDASEMIKGAHIITSSVLFRNLIVNYPSQFLLVANGDTFLFSLLGNYGSGKYIDEIMSCYRRHSGGVWSSNSLLKKTQMAQNTYHELHNYYSSIQNERWAKYFYRIYIGYNKTIKNLNCQNNVSVYCLCYKTSKKIDNIFNRIKNKIKILFVKNFLNLFKTSYNR